MGAYKYIKKSFEKTAKGRNPILRARLEAWRKQPGVVRAENPLNPARARELGYKALKEIIVARVRVGKGMRSRPKAKMGRKPGKNVKRVSMSRPMSWMAVQKALKRFSNTVPVGVYKAASDGDSEYFEVILSTSR